MDSGGIYVMKHIHGRTPHVWESKLLPDVGALIVFLGLDMGSNTAPDWIEDITVEAYTRPSSPRSKQK